MKVKFKPTTMDCIQFHNNYEEVVQFIKDNYEDDFILKFELYSDENYGEDYTGSYMEVNMTDRAFCDDECCMEMHLIDDRDYIVCLPTGELSLYDEVYFDLMFEEVDE